jgi:hypothetical protein
LHHLVVLHQLPVPLYRALEYDLQVQLYVALDTEINNAWQITIESQCTGC